MMKVGILVLFLILVGKTFCLPSLSIISPVLFKKNKFVVFGVFLCTILKIFNSALVTKHIFYCLLNLWRSVLWRDYGYLVNLYMHFKRISDSAIKKNTFESVLMRWMKLERGVSLATDRRWCSEKSSKPSGDFAGWVRERDELPKPWRRSCWGRVISQGRLPPGRDIGPQGSSLTW